MIEKYLLENEKLFGKVEFSKGGIYATDRRLIVVKGREFYDAMLWRIPSFQFKKEVSNGYLYAAIAFLVSGFIFKALVPRLPNEVLLFFIIFGLIPLVLYFLSRKTVVKIFIEDADPIEFEVKSTEAVLEINKLIRHLKSDIRIEKRNE